jgi:hypothetical protein
MQLPEAIRTERLHVVARVFAENVTQVYALFTLPFLVAAVGSLHGRRGSIASAPSDTAQIQLPINESGDPFGYEYGIWILERCSPAANISLDAWLTAILLGVWTAFEALAGDLWVESLNTNPQPLARLAGSATRIQMKSKAATNKDSADQSGQDMSRQEKEMTIPIVKIHNVTKGKYDLRAQMGTLLKSKIEFTRLSSIRRAYSLAFDQEKLDANMVNSIDSALADGALDALSAVRNLIMHNAGKADGKYDERRKAASDAGILIPALSVGQRLQLDGEIVKSLTTPVVECCMKIITSVDAWIATGLSRPRLIDGLGI